MAAGLGGARTVCSVDRDSNALDLATKNWELNQLEKESHATLEVDVFEWLQEDKIKYDMVICDPPSLAKSKKQKDTAINKYIETFSNSANRVNPGGMLCLSSCSSQINFDDFYEILKQSLSKSRRRGKVLRFGGQGMDHPFPHALPEMRYLKFIALKLD